jgi:hypothetical protein
VLGLLVCAPQCPSENIVLFFHYVELNLSKLFISVKFEYMKWENTFKIHLFSWIVVVHTSSSNTWEAKAVGL